MRFASLIVMAGMLGGVPLLTGCDRTVAHEKEVKTTNDGGMKSKETTVKQNDDGTVSKKTETKSVTP